MKNYFTIMLLFSVAVLSVNLTSCKDKKEHPLVDMESINYDGSHDEKYIFREELKKEQEKKERLEKYKKKYDE